MANTFSMPWMSNENIFNRVERLMSNILLKNESVVVNILTKPERKTGIELNCIEQENFVKKIEIPKQFQ